MGLSTVTVTLLGFLYIASTLTDATTETPKMELVVNKKDVSVGTRVLLFCRANKATTFKWMKDGEELDESEMNIDTDEEKSRLTLENVKLSDSGKYTCSCDFHGKTHEETVNIYVYEPIKFGATKTYHEFLVNNTVLVPCVATGKPEVEINWYWSGARVLNDKSDLKVLPDGSLQIINIQKENHGTYACEGKIKGRPTSELLNISVVVNVPPSVIVRPESTKVVAGPENSVTLYCLATGAPHPNITWEMPNTSDSSRYIYNSDKSKLIIPAVARSDFGEYVCTAANKIGEARAALTLEVTEIPTVSLSQNEMILKLGDSVSVFCNASGHPTPSVQWLNKNLDGNMPSTGRVRAEGSHLKITNVESSDGGVYTCKASNEAGSNNQIFTLMTSPEVPISFTLSPGPSGFQINLQKPVLNGGSPIIQYIIQWRKESKDKWNEITIPFKGVLKVTSLDAYTEYFVRIAAKNKYFLGSFSPEGRVRTLAEREPDMPELSPNEGKTERNSYSVPIKKISDGSSPITHYAVRYRMNKEGESWREKKTDANSTSIHFQNLEYDSNYVAEIFAVNSVGFSKPVQVSFSIPQAQQSLGKGGVVAIVLVIFLLLLVGVDALCCYKNRCGMLNFLVQKLFGPNVNVPQSKSLEEGVYNNIAVTMNGLEKPGSNIPKLQSQNKTGNGTQTEITCDKAPLTKFEKAPAEADTANEAQL